MENYLSLSLAHTHTRGMGGIEIRKKEESTQGKAMHRRVERNG